MENWIIFSFLSGLIFAIVNTIDKYKVFDSINLSHPVFCIFAAIAAPTAKATVPATIGTEP